MSISRAALPQEFFDITSAQLLTEPEPQYLHALLIKMALAASFPSDGLVGVPVQGRQFGSGPPYGDGPDSGRLVLADPIHGSAVRAVVEMGNDQVGHTVRLNRPAFVDSTYTMASREVPAGGVISTTPTQVGSTQVPLTLKRFVGPFDNAQSAPAPIAVERFDAGRSIHSVAAVQDMHLKRDFDKTIDSFGVWLFDQSAGVTYSQGFAADDDIANEGAAPLDYITTERVAAAMDRRNIPTFPNGRRAMVLHPEQCTELAGDRRFGQYASEHKDFNPLFKGTYWKSVGAFDIFKSTSLTSVANSHGVQVRRGQAFGPAAVGVGAGGMPRTAYNTQDNYGETSLVVWIWYAAFSTLDERFIQSVRSG